MNWKCLQSDAENTEHWGERHQEPRGVQETRDHRGKEPNEKRDVKNKLHKRSNLRKTRKFTAWMSVDHIYWSVINTELDPVRGGGETWLNPFLLQRKQEAWPPPSPPPSLSSSCLKAAGAWATQTQTWRQWESWCWCWDYWWALTARWEHETPRWRRRKGSWEEEEEDCSPLTPGRLRPPHWERRGAIWPDPGESTNHCLLTLSAKEK